MAPSFTSRPSYTRQSTFPGTQSFSQQSPFPGDHSHIPTRQSTFPGYYNLSRHKPRRWPLVLRVSKGSVHFDILLPVLLHSAFTSLIVYLDMYWRTLGLPGTIIPSLSIVVGLMLVFRNGTSYDRFWAGRNCLASIITGVRNLTRYFLVCDRSLKTDEATDDQRQDTESVVRLLVAMLHAVKHHLRAEFATSACPSAPPTPYLTRSGTATPISSLHNSQFVGPNTPLLAQSMASTLRATYTDLLSVHASQPREPRRRAPVAAVAQRRGVHPTRRAAGLVDRAAGRDAEQHAQLSARGFRQDGNHPHHADAAGPFGAHAAGSGSLPHDSAVCYGGRDGVVGGADYGRGGVYVVRDRRDW